jgi:hypothetical protein
MAKKSRRKRKKRQIRLSATQLVQPGVTEVADGSFTLAPAVEEVPDLREEYDHVTADLKRMGIVAAAALAVVMVLVLVLV